MIALSVCLSPPCCVSSVTRKLFVCWSVAPNDLLAPLKLQNCMDECPRRFRYIFCVSARGIGSASLVRETKQPLRKCGQRQKIRYDAIRGEWYRTIRTTTVSRFRKRCFLAVAKVMLLADDYQLRDARWDHVVPPPPLNSPGLKERERDSTTFFFLPSSLISLLFRRLICR